MKEEEEEEEEEERRAGLEGRGCVREASVLALSEASRSTPFPTSVWVFSSKASKQVTGIFKLTRVD